MSILTSTAQMGAGRVDMRESEDVIEKKKDMALKKSCQDFEGVLTSIIIKQGMKSAQEASFATDADDDRDNGSKQYIEMANEQIGYHIGRNGMLGLGESLYNSLKSRMQEIKK